VLIILSKWGSRTLSKGRNSIYRHCLGAFYVCPETIQGAVVVAGGLCRPYRPLGLLDIDSFMTVTGPKTDVWLVQTVSVVLLAIGLTLISHALVRARPLSALVPDGLTSTKGINRRILLTILTICGRVWAYTVDREQRLRPNFLTPAPD
jgi:hypothetical protein